METIANSPQLKYTAVGYYPRKSYFGELDIHFINFDGHKNIIDILSIISPQKGETGLTVLLIGIMQNGLSGI